MGFGRVLAAPTPPSLRGGDGVGGVTEGGGMGRGRNGLRRGGGGGGNQESQQLTAEGPRTAMRALAFAPSILSKTYAIA